MTKVIIFGNSGSGKSTLAKALVNENNLAHLDLDTIAWKPVSPPERMLISDSKDLIDEFLSNHQDWVVEGCYADLLQLVIPKAEEIIFLNLPVSTCIENARKRPWEPHKYESKEAQDANLEMLIDWISQYDSRTDTFSRVAHESLFEKFQGKRSMFTSNDDRA